MGTYWARHLPTDSITVLYEQVDAAVTEIVKLVTQLAHNRISPLAQARFCISIRYGGMVLRSLTDRQHAEYLGGLV